MAKPWKSSDGGTITKLGASSATLTAAGTIVSGAANVKGVTIRTVAGYVTGGGAMTITAGGVPISAIYGNSTDLVREIFVPAGIAIAVALSAGAMSVGITYDIH